MAIFHMSDDAVARREKGLRRGRFITYWIVGAVIMVDVLLASIRLGWLNTSIKVNEDLFMTIVVVSFVVFAQWLTPGSFKRTSEAVLASIKVQSLEIDSDEIRTENGRWSRRLRLDEISRAEEPRKGLGLYLRTSSSFRWLLIPKRLQGYEEIKAIVSARGIPVIQTRMSPQWIDFPSFLVVMASMISELVIRNRQVVLANIVLGVFVAIFGIFIALGRSEDKVLRFQYGLFFCLPLIFAIVFWI